MKDFREYLNESEEKEYDELNEGAIQIAANILVFGSAAALAAWGGSLLFVKASNLITKIVDNVRKGWKKFKNLGSKEIKDVVDDIKSDPAVKRQKDGMERVAKKYEDELMHVSVAIEDQNWLEAKNEFMNLPKHLRNNPDVKKVIITDITKASGEPPLYVSSPGNKTYQAIKKVLDISTARAAATATRMALDKQIEQMEESTSLKKKSYLTEGIVFFKNSIRLRKLAEKINQQIRLEDDNRKRSDLKEFRNTLLEVADDFEDFEIKYKIKKVTGKKDQAARLKHSYKKLELKYLDLINQINKESVIETMRNFSAVFFALKVLIFGAMFFGTLGEAAIIMNQENSQFLGLSGVFNRMSGKSTVYDFMDESRKTIFGIGAFGLGASALIKIVSNAMAKLKEKRVIKKTIDIVKKIMRKE